MGKEFTAELSEELCLFLSELKDAMLRAETIAKMIYDKAAKEWMDLEDEFLSLQDDVKNNQGIFLAGEFIGAMAAFFSIYHFDC